MREIKSRLMDNARGHFISGDFSSSISEVKRLLSSYENDTDVMTLFGNILEGILYQLDVENFEGYSIDDVIAIYKKILGMDPNNFHASVDIADILLDRGQKSEAKKFYLNAMKSASGVDEEELAHVKESLEDCG